MTPKDHINVVTADQSILADLVPLFDGYRQFYGYPSDPVLAERFLAERLRRGDSVLLLAYQGDRPVGFVQCYPGLSSLECRPGWLLSDLYVLALARRQGVARALLEKTRELAHAQDACVLELFTARSNGPAQRLYEAQGYREDKQFLHYELTL